MAGRDECTCLRSHATGLHERSGHKYCPAAQGLMMMPVRVTLAFRLGMEESKTTKVMVKVLPTAAEVSTPQDLMPCWLNK